jgi:hypothetical protein
MLAWYKVVAIVQGPLAGALYWYNMQSSFTVDNGMLDCCWRYGDVANYVTYTQPDSNATTSTNVFITGFRPTDALK